MNECIICREGVFIPVELTCFRCHKKNSISCSSFCRVCRKCAHGYLQLDVSVDERDFFKKCLYCPALCSGFFMTADSAYRKDFVMMQNDVFTGHSCPYCEHVQGTQMSLDQHLDTECPEFFVQCSCGTTLKRKDYMFHLPACLHHEECEECHKYISLTLIENHMTEEHSFIKCTLCEKYFFYRDMSRHIRQECPERMIQCEYCRQGVKCSKMLNHMEQHERLFEHKFNELSEEISRVLEEYRIFRRIRHHYLNTLRES